MSASSSPTAATSAPADRGVGDPDEVANLRAELEGAREELGVARSELIQACVGESRAKSESNHMNFYLVTLHDKWAPAMDGRSLEDVVDEAMTRMTSAVSRADELAGEVGRLNQQLHDIEQSRVYRLLKSYVRVANRLIPVGSRRRAFVLKIIR